MEHGLVVLDLLLPADQDASEAVHPGMGPLNYPSPGRVALDFTLGPHFLTPRLHMEHISPSPAKSPDLLKVKTLIKAEVLRGLFGEWGIVVDYASKCALCKLHVVPIGSIYRNREWNAACLSRSEEHTSELQSRGQLVCRLLLEKKKSSILTPRCLSM